MTALTPLNEEGDSRNVFLLCVPGKQEGCYWSVFGHISAMSTCLIVLDEIKVQSAEIKAQKTPEECWSLGQSVIMISWVSRGR